MAHRSGEKLGWLGGWLGSFLWIGLLGLMFLLQGKTGPGIAGIVLFGIALASISAAAPWKHPSTRYWKLMLPLYALLALSIPWAVWAAGGLEAAGLNGWLLLLALPLLSPFLTVGQLRWADREPLAAPPKETPLTLPGAPS